MQVGQEIHWKQVGQMPQRIESALVQHFFCVFQITTLSYGILIEKGCFNHLFRFFRDPRPTIPICDSVKAEEFAESAYLNDWCYSWNQFLWLIFRNVYACVSVHFLAQPDSTTNVFFSAIRILSYLWAEALALLEDHLVQPLGLARVPMILLLSSSSFPLLDILLSHCGMHLSNITIQHYQVTMSFWHSKWMLWVREDVSWFGAENAKNQ